MEAIVSELKASLTEGCESDFDGDSEQLSCELSKAECKEDQDLELGRSVCYIVGAMLIDQAGRVVLIKEAKPSCRGKWYFPAGRLEPNESLVEGTKREVLEETGFEIQPTALISVEALPLYNRWFRFTFAGIITGGKLKSLDEQDKESMEAKWFTKDEVSQLDLRATDFVPILDIALKWVESKKQNPLFSSLPVKKAHCKIFARLVMISRQQVTDGAGENMQVLVRKSTSCSPPGLPIGRPSYLDYYIHQTVESFVKKDNTLLVPHKIHGIISIEHDSSSHADGICITLLAEATSEQSSLPEGYMWFPVKNKATCDKITEVINYNGCVFHHHGTDW